MPYTLSEIVRDLVECAMIEPFKYGYAVDNDPEQIIVEMFDEEGEVAKRIKLRVSVVE